MKWTERTWAQAEPIYNNITSMPFVQELMAGTLDVAKFKYYLEQDAHYLEYFGRALSLISAKSHSVDNVLNYIKYAEMAIVGERELHDSYFKQYNISELVPMSPTCHHYVHYLQSETYMSQVEVGMAAVLPCFWIYQKVGHFIYDNQIKGDNPYQDWINAYSTPEFDALVEGALAICDAAAERCSPEQQERMTEAFLTASRLEWAFWDSAYKLEKWD